MLVPIGNNENNSKIINFVKDRNVPDADAGTLLGNVDTDAVMTDFQKVDLSDLTGAHDFAGAAPHVDNYELGTTKETLDAFAEYAASARDASRAADEIASLNLLDGISSSVAVSTHPGVCSKSPRRMSQTTRLLCASENIGTDTLPSEKSFNSKFVKVSIWRTHSKSVADVGSRESPSINILKKVPSKKLSAAVVKAALPSF